MKKSRLVFICSLLAISGCSLNFSVESAESITKPDNKPYSDIVNQECDGEYIFSSSLNTSISLFPLSKGTTYYFSNDGDDNNIGTISTSPYKSLNKANSLNLLPGDSVLFRCGDTFTGNLSYSGLKGVEDNPITFASYGEGAKPIITNGSINNDNSDVVSFIKASNIVFRDLEVDVFSKDRLSNGTNCINGICFRYPYVQKEKFENIYIVNNVVKGNDIGANAMGIVIQSDEATVATSPHGVLTHGIISYNEVSNLGRSGIHSGGWLYQQTINQNEGLIDKYYDLHFDHNIVHDVGCMGIYPMDVTDATCNYNLVYNTGMYDKNQTMEGECGIMTLCAQNVDVMFNEIHHCYDQHTGYDAMGIDIDWNCNNINVQYNYCHDNQGPGIGTMANQNSFIRNNRLENNQGATNHNGSISITNYTSRYDAVNPEWHSVKNLLIDNNFIQHNNVESYVFCCKNSNGDTDYEGNVFSNNRVVYLNDDVSEFTWHYIDNRTPWYQFKDNYYFSKNTEIFKVDDGSDYFEIDSEENGGQALPYEPTEEYLFEEWALRDIGSSYELIDENTIPANPYHPKVTYENQKLCFTWLENDGDIWHYNIFKVNENESISYLNMLGETYNNYFEYVPQISEEAYYIIQPESNQGHYGKALKLKVSL